MMLGVANSIGLNMSLNDFLDFATWLKLELVEIKMDEPHLLSAISKTKHKKTIRDIVKSFNFEYFVHAPYIDINLASMNPALRKASEKTILKSIAFAADIDAKLVVSHVGRLSRDYLEEMITESLKNVIPCLRSLTKAIFKNVPGIMQGRGKTFLRKHIRKVGIPRAHPLRGINKKMSGGGAESVYGRMTWSKPSPTITSRCTVTACGRFIHPDQDRAITPREAARLQSFDDDYNADPVRVKALVASLAEVNIDEALKSAPAFMPA